MLEENAIIYVIYSLTPVDILNLSYKICHSFFLRILMVNLNYKCIGSCLITFNEQASNSLESRHYEPFSNIKGVLPESKTKILCSCWRFYYSWKKVGQLTDIWTLNGHMVSLCCQTWAQLGHHLVYALHNIHRAVYHLQPKEYQCVSISSSYLNHRGHNYSLIKAKDTLTWTFITAQSEILSVPSTICNILQITQVGHRKLNSKAYNACLFDSAIVFF